MLMKRSRTFIEVETNGQNSYTDINKTMIMDLTNTVKVLFHNHDNVFWEKRDCYSAPFNKLNKVRVIPSAIL